MIHYIYIAVYYKTLGVSDDGDGVRNFMAVHTNIHMGIT